MAAVRKKATIIDEKLTQLRYQGFFAIKRWEVLSVYPDRTRLTQSFWAELRNQYIEKFGLEDESVDLSYIKCDDTTTPQEYVVIDRSRSTEIDSY